MFDHIVGNEPLKLYLQKALEQSRLPQTLLFEGMDGIGKSLFAKSLAKELLGDSFIADFHFYQPEGKSRLYLVDTLREMMEKEHSSSFGSKGKVFVLEDMERMQPVSANALLKTLEEPNPDTTFILLTSEIRSILPTILSRCMTLHFQPLSFSEIEKVLESKGLSKDAAKHCNGSLKEALLFAENPEIERQKKIIFSLLSKRVDYPEIYFALSQMEEKSPDLFSLRGKELLKLILMWYRDQHVLKEGLDPKYLFFRGEERREPICLFQIQEKLKKAEEALERNIHPLTVFASIFLTSQALS